MITQQRLKEVLNYSPDTGVFLWRKPLSNRAIVGTEAGDIKPSGYRFIGIDGRRYRAHILAWVWMTGERPKSILDHKDGQRANNRWENIRLADCQKNGANSKRRKNNTSGFKGVNWNKQKNRWYAKINVGDKQIHLGSFTDASAAHAAYLAGAKKYFGEFARGE